MFNIKKLEVSDKKEIYQKLKEKQFISITSPEIPKKFWEELDVAIGDAIKVEDYKKAISLLDALDINEGKKNYGLGICFEKMGESNKAVKHYLTSIKHNDSVATYNLACLYDSHKKYYLAEKYYLKAISFKIVPAIKNLSLLYYEENQRDKLRQLIENNETEFNKENILLKATLYLFLKDLTKFNLILNSIPIDNYCALPGEFLYKLLVHKQYALVYEIFENYPIVMEEHRPLYYVALKFLKDKEKEQLKTPPEFEESIRDIYQSLMKEQEFYYGDDNKKIKNKTK